MLITEALYTDGTKEEFVGCTSLTLRKNADTPAHSLVLKLPSVIEKEICEVRLSDENGTLFEGIADEQNISFDENPETELVARSMEALLLDNEACPEIYKNPSSALIFSRYAKVCSLESFSGGNKVLEGVLKVYKGTSCYQVLRQFCEKVYGKTPFVSGRTLCTHRNEEGGEVLFSDSGEGIYASKIEKSYKRCELVSKVLVKTSADGTYNREIGDEEALLSGVCRQRFADVSAASAVSFDKAYEILSKGRAKAFEFNITVKGRVILETGVSASVKAGGREYGNLVIKDILYTLRNRKEETKFTLGPKEE